MEQPTSLCCGTVFGEGSEREQCHLLSSWQAFSHFFWYPQENWALLVQILRWVGLCSSRTRWVSPMNSPVKLGVSATTSIPQVFSVRGFISLCLFPKPWRTLGFAVCLTPQLFLLAYLHTNVGQPVPPPTASLPLVLLQPAPCHESSPPWLPISTPPTSMDEYFFFNSLAVGCPYSLIFWQFWLYFVFKFVVVLLLVVWGGKVYLYMSPSWLEIFVLLIFFSLFILKSLHFVIYNTSDIYFMETWKIVLFRNKTCTTFYLSLINTVFS